jgi:hypothetical protein
MTAAMGPKVKGDAVAAVPVPVNDTERRKSPRVLVDLEVDYASEENYLFAYITDMSATGIFVRTTTPEAPGTHLNLRFSSEHSGLLEVEGEVIEKTLLVTRLRTSKHVDVTVPNSTDPLADSQGAVLYYGLVSAEPFSAVTISSTLPTQDFFGFDDVTIAGDAAVPTVSEWGLVALTVAGLVAGGFIFIRRSDAA